MSEREKKAERLRQRQKHNGHNQRDVRVRFAGISGGRGEACTAAVRLPRWSNRMEGDLMRRLCILVISLLAN